MADDAGALLVRSGLVSASALEDARARVARSGGTVGEQLVVGGVLADDMLTDFYRSRLLVPQVNPNTLARLSAKVVASIPSDMAIELRAIPVSLDQDNNLTVAMSDPSDRHAVDEIAFFTGAYVVRAVATQMQIAWCLAHYYGHVTALGQRLLHPSEVEGPAGQLTPRATPQPLPRTKGFTGKVEASRHRAIAPITAPVDVQRPASGLLEPTAGQQREPARDNEGSPWRRPADAEPRAVLESPSPDEPSADAAVAAEQPRARSVSGEIRVPRQRAQSIKPPLPPDDDDSGPVITMEVDADDDPTGPRTVAPPRRRQVKSDPPELAARVGEVDIHSGPTRHPLDTDRSIVVAEDVDEPLLPAVSGEFRAVQHRDDAAIPMSTIEVSDEASAGVMIHDRIYDPEESKPILLERRRTQSLGSPPPPTSARDNDPTTIHDRAPSNDDDDDPADDEIVVLDETRKKKPSSPPERPGTPPPVAPSTRAATPLPVAPSTRAATPAPVAPTPTTIKPRAATPPPVFAPQPPGMSRTATPPAGVQRTITRPDGSGTATPPGVSRTATPPPMSPAISRTQTPAPPVAPATRAATPSPVPRSERRTKIGIAVTAAATVRSHRDTTVDETAIPEEYDDRPTTADIAAPDPSDDSDGNDASDGTPTDEMSATQPSPDDDTNPHIVAPPPRPARMVASQRPPSEDDDDAPVPAHVAASRQIDYDPVDDGWGPPGTTIPPPLLGAIPGSDDDVAHSAIPMSNIDSAPLMVAPPSPPEPTRSNPHISLDKSGQSLVQALEVATSRAIDLIRLLEHARERDEVVAAMIAHLAETHRRAGFFSIKMNPAKVTEISLFQMMPKPASIPAATLRLDRPSTLQDVVGTRLPYRGPMHDDDSRTFLTSVLGACPPEILLVPVTVRERVVGVLFGEHRNTHTFDDQLALAARAAGMALERILKSKRG